MGERRLDSAERAVHDLERQPEAVRRGGAVEALGAALRHPPVERADHERVCRDRSSQEIRVRTHRTHDALAAVEQGQPREAVSGALERQREGRHAAPVDPDHQ